MLVGDGATSEGDMHEALNFAGVWQAPVVFLVQNNGYAISVPLAKQTAAPALAYRGVGYGVRSMLIDGNDAAAVFATVLAALARAAAGCGPTLIEAVTYRIEAHTNADDAARYRSGAEVEAWLARDPVRRLEIYLRERGLLDDAGLARISAAAEQQAADLREAMSGEVKQDPAELFAHVYAQPTRALAAQREFLLAEIADGGDQAVTGTLEQALAQAGPAQINTERTGREPAATRPAAPGSAMPGTGPVTMVAALNAALADALADDPRVLVFGEDVGTLGGVFRVTDGLAARFGEERVFDTPLAEAGIVGTAIGMAMNGLVPVVEMQFDAFAYPAFEQVTSHLAKLRNRTRGHVSLPIVVRIPYGGGIGGVEHHCDASEAYYAHTPACES